jgi:aspartyl-tRNA(Asn)/glutamyl-tRNA(Gln) amidotransferase subunit A
MSPREPLHTLTAAELVSGFRAGTFSPADALREVFTRTDAVNPRINALIAEDRKAATVAAEVAGSRWREGKPLSALDGVPTTIKDNLFARGLPATWGSIAYRNLVPGHDELPVARLRAAGAIIIGKTNVPEFTLQGYASNALFGTTINPLTADRTPGGSTGGGAACVAAGIGPLTIGTDGGGSLRRPAAHCGLFGFKPSIGQVARGNGLPQILADFEVVGPIARSLEDLLLTFGLLRGYDPGDSRSLAALTQPEPMPARPRIGYFPTVGTAPVDPVIRAAVDAFARRLADGGAVVEEIEAPFSAERLHTHWGRIAAAGLAWHARSIPESEQLGENARNMIAAGRALSAADYADALETCLGIRSEAAQPFARFDLLLSPTTAALAWPAAEAFPPRIDGREAGPRGHAVFTAWANVADLAGLTVPVGSTEDAGGIGAQLLAAPGRDLALLEFSLSNPVLRDIGVVRPTPDASE